MKNTTEIIIFSLLFPLLLFPGAKETFTKAHQNYFYAREDLENGKVKEGRDLLDEAFKDYLHLLKKYPKSKYEPEALFRIGMIYRERKEYEKTFQIWLLLNFLYPSSKESKQTSFFIINRSPLPGEMEKSFLFPTLNDRGYLYILKNNLLAKYNPWAEFAATLTLHLPPHVPGLQRIVVLKEMIVGMRYHRIYLFNSEGEYLRELPSFPDSAFDSIAREKANLVIKYSRLEEKLERKNGRNTSYTIFHPYRMVMKLPKGEIIRDTKYTGEEAWYSRISEHPIRKEGLEFLVLLSSEKTPRVIKTVIQDKWGKRWATLPRSFYYYLPISFFYRERAGWVTKVSSLSYNYLFTSRGNILFVDDKYVYSLFPPPSLLYYLYGEKRFYSSILKREYYLRIPDTGWREYIRALKELEKGNTWRARIRLKKLISTNKGEEFSFPVSLILINQGKEKEGENILLKLSETKKDVAKYATEYLMNFYRKRGKLEKAFSLGMKLRKLYQNNYKSIAFLWKFQEETRYFPYVKKEPLGTTFSPPLFSLKKKLKILQRPLSRFDTIAVNEGKIYLATEERRIKIFSLKGENIGESNTGILPSSIAIEGDTIALRGENESKKEVIKIVQKGHSMEEIKLNDKSNFTTLPPYVLRNKTVVMKGTRLYLLTRYIFLKVIDLKGGEEKEMELPPYRTYLSLLVDKKKYFYLFCTDGLRKVDKNTNLIFFSPWEAEGMKNGVFLRGENVLACFFPGGKVIFIDSNTGEKLAEENLSGLNFLRWNIPLARSKSGDIYLLDRTGDLWILKDKFSSE